MPLFARRLPAATRTPTRLALLGALSFGTTTPAFADELVLSGEVEVFPLSSYALYPATGLRITAMDRGETESYGLTTSLRREPLPPDQLDTTTVWVSAARLGMGRHPFGEGMLTPRGHLDLGVAVDLESGAGAKPHVGGGAGLAVLLSDNGGVFAEAGAYMDGFSSWDPTMVISIGLFGSP